MKIIKGVIKMLPLTINLTPTMITFKNLPDEVHLKLFDVYDIEAHPKGYHFIKGKPAELYKILLELSYTYDLEVI